MYRNPATSLCAVVLAVGLAACGGSSNNNRTPETTPPPPPPPLTEVETILKEARTAAMTASGKAMTASDNAGTSADEAETATMGLMFLHTPKGAMTAKSYADAARTAANMAKAEYDKAKMESDKAAATDDVRAATKAKVAAEAAQAQAEAQAATAAEKAKMATEAAAREVRHVEGMTYEYGGTRITAGAPKVTVKTGGKTVESGKAGDLTDDSTRHSKDPVAYVAATENKPEVAARTGFYGRLITIGSYTDSEQIGSGIDSEELGSITESEQFRLWLVHKYVTNTKAVKAYRKDSGTNGAEFTAPVTAENPFGSRTVDSKTYKIMRAEGEFYRVDTDEHTKFDKTNANDWINVTHTDANAGVGVYYYTDSSGKKVYLLSTGADGATGLKYRPLLVYDVPDFPEAKPYEHVNFGMWNKRSNRTHLGITFVRALPGKGPTPTANMPSFGTATYEGHAVLQRRGPNNAPTVGGRDGPATTTVDFGESTIKTEIRIVAFFPNPAKDSHGHLLHFATLHGTIDGNRFSGSKVTNVNTTTTGAGGFTPAQLRDIVNLAMSEDGSLYELREYSGHFFGPNGEEVGGVFEVTSKDKKSGEFRGSFGGRRE